MVTVFINLVISANEFIEFSSIDPIELYIKYDDNKTDKANNLWSILLLLSIESKPSVSIKNIFTLSLSLYIGLDHIHKPLVQALTDPDTIKPFSLLNPIILFNKKLLPVLYLPTIEHIATPPSIYFKYCTVSGTISNVCLSVN